MIAQHVVPLVPVGDVGAAVPCAAEYEAYGAGRAVDGGGVG